MKNHVQLNPIISDFKRIDINYFVDILDNAFQPYFPSCLLFYRRVMEIIIIIQFLYFFIIADDKRTIQPSFDLF